MPYLRRLGINRVDMLLVTHRDGDHAGGTASVLSALNVGEMRSSVTEIAGRQCVAGQRWVSEGVEFEMLHPDAEAYAVAGKANHLSCVLSVLAGGRRMLLTSDIEAPDEMALLARCPGQLAANVLLVPHPRFAHFVDTGFPGGGGAAGGGDPGPAIATASVTRKPMSLNVI